MSRCTRKGCGKELTQDDSGPCVYHSGAPVFHEGLKSWSCCSDVYKPVLDFDEFMKIPLEKHTTEAPAVPAQAPSAPEQTSDAPPAPAPAAAPLPPAPAPTAPPAKKPAPPPVVEEEDDLSAPVAPGTICRHKGCGLAFVSDEENRLGEGEGTTCTYHPMAPIFHEGSKGYLCCKRRVLEFDEFLKIGGCKKGRHVFVPKKDPAAAVEEQTTCRIDHYQTTDKVYVSVFAKKADKERSTVKFESDKAHVDLFLPDSKRFTRTLDLFGPISDDKSTFQFFGTKIELCLQKADGRSWTLLEKTDRDLGNIQYTFGVGGRTGTVGAKTIVT
ncbi:HSP20-like chaperone [Schizophyllum amplum]|uniref:HSP20-like chaperone n=1 Tax=Schizophyllum amplum TaxID=97359 RepID=A0A550CD55_9AGAR|nr:HSP20-like chaperone [Auriculariopsis ampla]